MNRRELFAALTGSAAGAALIEPAQAPAQAVLNKWPTIDQPLEQWILIEPYRVAWSGWQPWERAPLQVSGMFYAIPIQASEDPLRAYPDLYTILGEGGLGWPCRRGDILYSNPLFSRLHPPAALRAAELDGFLRVKALIASRDWEGYWEKVRNEAPKETVWWLNSKQLTFTDPK